MYRELPFGKAARETKVSENVITEVEEMPLHMQRDGFDPVPELADVRDSGSVRRVRTSFGLDAWMITNHDDVRTVLSDAARFSNARTMMRPTGAAMDEAEAKRWRAGNPLAFDPPEHTRLRRFLTPEFTVRRMRRLEPRITEIVDDHLDAMQRSGPPADLISEFALPIPSLVICELLGVPYADRETFQHRTSRLLNLAVPAEYQQHRRIKGSEAESVDMAAALLDLNTSPTSISYLTTGPTATPM